MTPSFWGLFPYPTLANGEFIHGSLLAVHADCLACPTRACAQAVGAPPGEVAVCRFGLSYAHVDDERVIVGLVASDGALTQKARRRLRTEPARRVRSSEVRAAALRASELGGGVVVDFERARDEALRRIGEDESLHRAVAEQLKKEFEETLNRSHDFLQLVKLVKGHAEALLYEKYPELLPEQAAEKLPTEGAIYFSTELMLVKMDSLTFLREANLASGGEKRFRIHSLILKYVRIYRWQALQKNVEVSFEGECYSTVYYNGAAIGAVVQGLLDNMVKYSPPGSKARIEIGEVGEEIWVAFSSLGPRIDPSERERIFLPGVRGAAAREMEAGGLGVGLASAKAISDVLDLGLTVEQSDAVDPKYANRYLTTFRLVLQRTQ